MVTKVCCVWHTLNPSTHIYMEPHNFCIPTMVAIFLDVWVRFFYKHTLILVVYHPKPSFLMHEGYVQWAVKLQILKQILNCINAYVSLCFSSLAII